MYGSDTVPAGRVMVEPDSNFTFECFKDSVASVLPDEHQLHETAEITQGWKDWFETGFYIFTSRAEPEIPVGGNHNRLGVRLPKSWHRPVSVSPSTETPNQG